MKYIQNVQSQKTERSFQHFFKNKVVECFSEHLCPCVVSAERNHINPKHVRRDENKSTDRE